MSMIKDNWPRWLEFCNVIEFLFALTWHSSCPVQGLCIKFLYKSALFYTSSDNWSLHHMKWSCLKRDYEIELTLLYPTFGACENQCPINPEQSSFNLSLNVNWQVLLIVACTCAAFGI